MELNGLKNYFQLRVKEGYYEFPEETMNELDILREKRATRNTGRDLTIDCANVNRNKSIGFLESIVSDKNLGRDSIFHHLIIFDPSEIKITNEDIIKAFKRAYGDNIQPSVQQFYDQVCTYGFDQIDEIDSLLQKKFVDISFFQSLRV